MGVHRMPGSLEPDWQASREAGLDLTRNLLWIRVIPGPNM
jgi:hypothetical protein